ncbi:MAG: single-stranded-DNA-specific exonuclease RecJ [Chloroflexi bacterium]|nr:single-stranded-DNA-specific exonuclease RecJ [Chloroflexota bacterium]
MSSSAPAVLVGRRQQWRVAEPTDPSPLAPLPALVAHLLRRRGIHDADEARDFLNVSDSLFEDPGTLPDIEAAADRLALARRRGETAAVYGDFDADGVTGTALLVKALRRYGLRTLHYIPHRVSEGHGLNRNAVAKLHEQGAGLIVTVDCGVTNADETAYAGSLGVDVIITDHHLATAALPRSVAIINPRAPHSRYAFDHLTGVGMTLKLAQAVLRPEFGDDWRTGLMELAAIGTITDMAPLFGENRYIVHHGIRDLQRTQSVGLRALLDVARITPEHANVETLGFAIGPRLNAAGRLDHADIALDLLLMEDEAQAADLVRQLDDYNTQRRTLTDETLERARGLVPAQAPPLILVGEPGFNPGVVGLVAGRLAEEFGTPCAVFAMDGDQVMGSCRSAPLFHWADALAQCGDLLFQYGGHAQAAGFRCGVDVLPALQERLVSIAAERIGAAPVGREGVVDVEAQPHELMGPVFQGLRRMEPFGIGNPPPVFLARGMEVLRASEMGAEGKHFRLNVRSGGAIWEAVAFNQQWESSVQQVDLVYTLDVDHWNGQERLRMTVKDHAASARPRLAL